MIDESRAYELDRAHVFHSWSAQGAINPMVDHRGPRAPTSGTTRATATSTSPRQLVFTNIGHQHPRVVAAIQEQADRSARSRPASPTTARSEAARLIAELAPDGLEKVFFTNGGADANEHAVRMARLHTGRHQGAVDLPLLPRRHRSSRST